MHSEVKLIDELDVEIKQYQKEMSDLRRRILDLETECIGLILRKKKAEEDLRIYQLRKGLFSDGTAQ
jgi:predicted RNase H-like nuclease (RuvC/YqgF family)